MEIMLKIDHGVAAQVTSIFLYEVCTGLSTQVSALVSFYMKSAQGKTVYSKGP